MIKKGVVEGAKSEGANRKGREGRVWGREGSRKKMLEK